VTAESLFRHQNEICVRSPGLCARNGGHSGRRGPGYDINLAVFYSGINIVYHVCARGTPDAEDALA